jgi:hypothetical protein
MVEGGDSVIPRGAEMVDRVWRIYTLSDPRTDEVRYVGKTFMKLSNRLANHVFDTKNNTHRTNWIQSLLREGVRPAIHAVESGVGEDTWQEAEIRWIAHYGYGTPDCRLVNCHPGGQGGVTHTTTESTRAKISAALKGKPLSAATRAAALAANLGHKENPAITAARAAKLRGQVRTAIQRQRMVEAWKLRTPRDYTDEQRVAQTEVARAVLLNPEVQARRRAACQTEEYRKKQSESHKGHKQSAESIEKTMAFVRGVPKSDETKAKMAAGQAARHARQREAKLFSLLCESVKMHYTGSGE